MSGSQEVTQKIRNSVQKCKNGKSMLKRQENSALWVEWKNNKYQTKFERLKYNAVHGAEMWKSIACAL